MTPREAALLLTPTEWEGLASICDEWRQEHDGAWSSLDEPTQERLRLVRRVKDAAWGAP